MVDQLDLVKIYKILLKIYDIYYYFKLRIFALHYIGSDMDFFCTVCHSVMLDTSPMPPTSKNKSGLVKVHVHFNVY